MGLGLVHYVPALAYLGFWIAILVSLFGRPQLGMYYMLPFIPYRTLRDHLLDYPLGANLLTLLIIAVIVGALFQGKRLPKSKLYMIWFVYVIYLYLSMWMGSALTQAPAPLWLSDINFVTWKDYLVIPLVFVAASLTLDDRKSIRTAIMIVAISLFAIDRSSLLESLSHSWASFDENKRDGGPLAFGSNQTAAYLAQSAMFFWGFGQFVKKKYKLIAYGLTAMTLMATMYCFSRGAYLAVVVSVIVLGLVKDRKLILIAAVFLLTWQTIVPTAVTERVNMTHSEDGQLEASAQERVDLWTNAEQIFLQYPVFGSGFATFQFGEHVDNLKDTHNWYVKVLVETGLVGFLIAMFLFQQMFSVSVRVFRKTRDPMYRGLGLGLLVCLCSLAVTNFFGDRWTYLEINGQLWVLIGCAIRAEALTRAEAPEEESDPAGLPAGDYAYAS